MFTQYLFEDIWFIGEVHIRDIQLKVNSVEIVLKDMDGTGLNYLAVEYWWRIVEI